MLAALRGTAHLPWQTQKHEVLHDHEADCELYSGPVFADRRDVYEMGQDKYVDVNR